MIGKANPTAAESIDRKAARRRIDHGRLGRIAGILAGASLGIAALTNYRLSAGFGVGEVGLIVASLMALLPLTAGWKRSDLFGSKSWALICFLYIGVVLASITLVQFLSGVVGSSLRDLAAYLLVAALVAASAYGDLCVRRVILWIVVVYVASNIYHIVFAPEQAWYYGRYTGGAKNPNQMALYSALCIGVLSAIRASRWVKIAVTCFAIFIGLKTSSDAFLIYLLVFAAVAMLAIIVPYRLLPVLSIPCALLATVLWVAFWPEISQGLSLYVEAADEGGSRADLVSNGIRAWLDTPFSFFFGNGAGAFSGLYGPFEGAESHNTIVDFLAIGGLFGASLGIAPVLVCIRRTYQAGERLALASLVGILVFSMFHYVGRQPMYWLVVMAVLAHSSGAMSKVSPASLGNRQASG